MKHMSITLAAAALGCAVPVLATVPPLTSEGRLMLDKQQALEEAARRRFGVEVVEHARDWQRAYGAILVSEDRSNAIPRLLMKDEHGWYEVAPGRTQRLRADIGDALNALVLDEALFQERAFENDPACRRRARLFVIRHAGRELVGRQACTAGGLAARAGEIAATGRVPRTPVRTIAMVGAEPPLLGTTQAQRDASQAIFRRLYDMAAASQRKLLPAFVDVYAPDAVVERPSFTLRGREEIVRHVRTYQNWNPPGIGREVTMHGASLPPVNGDQVYGTHEFRWQEDGRPVRQTFSTFWRKRNGLWEIAYERGSEVKPVTDRRP